MKGAFTAALTATAVLALSAPEAQAQNYKFDVGIFGGGSWFSTMLDQDHIAGGTGDEDIRYEPGWIAGGQATFWLSPRLGLRADLGFSERPLQDADNAVDPDPNIAEDINLWGISGDLMFRFRQPNERWMGTEFLPYLALGLGIQRTNPPGNFTVVGVDAELENTAEDGLIFNAGTSSFMLADDNTLMGLVGLGADVRVRPNFALRLELNDRLFDPQIFALTQDAGGNFGFAEDPEEDIGKLTHWVSGQIGLHLLTGLQEPERVVVAPPPPAPAPPPAAPAPRPAPRVDAMTVCVVDPAAPGGLRQVSVLYRHATRDTVVVEMGDTVAFRTTVPRDVRLAPSATWYVSGQPLVMEFETTPRRVEFLTVGTSRVIPSSDLAFLGYVNGVPVYASDDDVAEVRDNWEDVLEENPDRNLGDWLDQREDLRNAFNDIEVLYVPVQPFGCVFQAVERQEEVRKGGK